MSARHGLGFSLAVIPSVAFRINHKPAAMHRNPRPMFYRFRLAGIGVIYAAYRVSQSEERKHHRVGE